MCQFHSFFFNSEILYTFTEAGFVRLDKHHLCASLAGLSPDIVFCVSVNDC